MSIRFAFESLAAGDACRALREVGLDLSAVAVRRVSLLGSGKRA